MKTDAAPATGQTACIPVNWDKWTGLTTTTGYSKGGAKAAGNPDFTSCIGDTAADWGIPVWCGAEQTPSCASGETRACAANTGVVSCTASGGGAGTLTWAGEYSGHAFFMETVSSDWTTITTGFGANNDNDFRTITQTVPAVGDMGDYYAVYMTNTENKFKIPVVKAGTAMTAAPVVDCDPKGTGAAALTDPTTYKYKVTVGTAAWAQQSHNADWAALATAIGTDWTKPTWPTDATVIPSWGAASTCDATIWASGTDCAGITMWGIGASVKPTGTTPGSFSAYHWLADKKPTDATKLFQIEDGAVINYVVQVHMGQWATSGLSNFGKASPSTAADAYDVRCTAASDAWMAGTFAFTMGASGFIGMTAAALAAFATLFSTTNLARMSTT